jgi:hypothetical protein
MAWRSHHFPQTSARLPHLPFRFSAIAAANMFTEQVATANGDSASPSKAINTIPLPPAAPTVSAYLSA